ncbi:unnamed protein product [Rotaria sordida]|uniref:Cation efflux protein cytoplasmic domain-containing protein n=1 Tax=Rotaria sordida TaxID=392033 RepID=A0A819AI32_9BILA|nr:unnamed protein product [Rotaria sordida]
MYHTNVSYDHHSDAVSINELSSNEQHTKSSKSIQRTSNHSITDQNFNLNNLSSTTIDEQQQNDTTSDQDVVNTENQPTNSSDDGSYYSLKHLRERRRGQRDEDSDLPRRVKRFYKHQDELIDVYERLYLQGSENGTEHDAHKEQLEKIKKMSHILAKVSLGVNICLFILKIAGAIISKSLSVVSSVIDSAVDLTTSVILFWAWRAIKRRDAYRYPQGRTRLEPIAIVILSVIMCAASVLVIYESVNTIVNDAQYFTQQNTTKTLTNIDMSALPVSVMVITIVSKAILFLLCYRLKTPTMSALSSDHRNDVCSNIVALFCGLIGSFAYRNKISQEAIVIDPIGAVLISLYIIITWIQQANGQVKRLSGHTADPEFLSQITWLTYNHSPLILKIDTVRAFYFGSFYLVEVDIVLPEDMLLKEAHDIGESLQNKLEDLPEVERAFVHIDHEYSHNPVIEHKIV